MTPHPDLCAARIVVGPFAYRQRIVADGIVDKQEAVTYGCDLGMSSSWAQERAQIPRTLPNRHDAVERPEHGIIVLPIAKYGQRAPRRPMSNSGQIQTQTLPELRPNPRRA